jgi:hypothetical protein
MPRARRSQETDDLIARDAPANRRRKPSARQKVLASRTTAAVLRPPRMIGAKAVFQWVAWIFLLPACLITTRTLASGFMDSMGQSFWQTPAFWFFALGFILWSIAFLWLPRPVRWYVWAHEMTHAVFTILCGGRVTQFHVTAKGGHVLTDKNNVLIALSPYFVPLYTVLVVPLCLLLGTVYDLTTRLALPGGFGFRPLWGVFLLIGLTWGFHATFTCWMIRKDQPDLRINGVFFSLTLIYLVNALGLAFLLTAAAPELTAAGFLKTWGENALGVLRILRDAIFGFRAVLR